MPFKWVKKTNRVPASPERMREAVKDVVEGSKLRTTAAKYKIDKMTLRRYVVKYNEKGNATTFSPNFQCSQIFDTEQEKAISEYLLIAARMNYGLTSKETRKLAYIFAVENKIKIPQNWTKNETASYVWLRGFMLRNNELALRTPEPTSLGRGTAFNNHTVGEFYEFLRTVLNRHQFGPESIYNCDETGVQTVHKPSKIISQKGQKQVSKATVPPVLIFPRVREQGYMTHGAPPGSQALTHPSGWMTAENFEAYLEHFIKFVKCSKEHKVLLILDNHSSHISPRGLNLCKDNGIVMLTIPPHTSHRLQPLDVSVYGPFKTYYNQACDDFMVNHPGQNISLKDIAALVGVAHQRAFTSMNIMKGFAKPGIYPFNAHIFTEDEFLSASVTDRPEPPRREYTQDPSANDAQPGPSGLQQTPPNLATNGAQGSTLHEHTSELTTNELAIDPQPSSFTKTPKNIRPLPKAPPRKKQTLGRKQVRTKILTDTPNMKEIEDDYTNRQQKNMKKINQVKRNISSMNTTNEVKKAKPTKIKKQEI